MCENRDGPVFVPSKPCGATGYWIGRFAGSEEFFKEMNGAEVALRPLNLLWVENSKCSTRSLLHSITGLKEFNSEAEALEWLKSKGVRM